MAARFWGVAATDLPGSQVTTLGKVTTYRAPVPTYSRRSTVAKLFVEPSADYLAQAPIQSSPHPVCLPGSLLDSSDPHALSLMSDAGSHLSSDADDDVSDSDTDADASSSATRPPIRDLRQPASKLQLRSSRKATPTGRR